MTDRRPIPPPPAAANPVPQAPGASREDPTEDIRRLMISVGQPQEDLKHEQGPVWTTEEAVAQFRFLAFAAPFVLVQRRSDGARGTLEFTHDPRRYFHFVPEER